MASLNHVPKRSVKMPLGRLLPSRSGSPPSERGEREQKASSRPGPGLRNCRGGTGVVQEEIVVAVHLQAEEPRGADKPPVPLTADVLMLKRLVLNVPDKPPEAKIIHE